MHDPHKNPNHIFTTYLALSHIFFSQDSSDVLLMDCYGNMLDLDHKTIEIETDFASLNDLLAGAGPQAERTIDRIATLLSKPKPGDLMIDMCDEGGILFWDHIFALMIIVDTDEEGNIEESEVYRYRLVGATPRENLIKDFIDLDLPATDQERLAYFHSLLAMQYAIYLTCRDKLSEKTSLIYSDITDPLCFSLAQTTYDLQITGQVNQQF